MTPEFLPRAPLVCLTTGIVDTSSVASGGAGAGLLAGLAARLAVGRP